MNYVQKDPVKDGNVEKELYAEDHTDGGKKRL